MLHFPMGKFVAEIPVDRLYARNHMWAWPAEGRFRFGLSAYAVRLLQDVYFLDWHVQVGDRLSERQEIGHIESSKAESDLYAPVSGTVVEINGRLLADPSGINLDKYGEGWLFSLETAGHDLLSPDRQILTAFQLDYVKLRIANRL